MRIHEIGVFQEIIFVCFPHVPTQPPLCFASRAICSLLLALTMTAKRHFATWLHSCIPYFVDIRVYLVVEKMKFLADIKGVYYAKKIVYEAEEH